jgi:hypothetical protein
METSVASAEKKLNSWTHYSRKVGPVMRRLLKAQG